MNHPPHILSDCRQPCRSDDRTLAYPHHMTKATGSHLAISMSGWRLIGVFLGVRLLKPGWRHHPDLTTYREIPPLMAGHLTHYGDGAKQATLVTKGFLGFLDD